MESLFPLTLEGRHVRMEPLSHGHLDGLVAAANEERATYALTRVPATPERMAAYVEEALAEARRGGAVPFATVDMQGGRVVGSTRFGNVEWWSWPGPAAAPVPSGPDAVEIGWTWLAASAQRTHVNTEVKLLMLRHAFEQWGVRRVTLKTDARNARSRANIERVGAQLDGILRAHMPAYDGGVRASAVYSILAADWPSVRERLSARLRPPIAETLR
jgi:RimJ/RimL family protein N-acetyltransferase